MKNTFLCIIASVLFTMPGYTQVSISNDNSPVDPSAGLEVKFNDKGVLIPRMTQAGRDAIVNPANGLIVICTDCVEGGTLSIFLDGYWRIAPVVPCNMTAPTGGAHIASSSQITWKWNAVEGAEGYKWNIVNDYGTATDLGADTSQTETGLACDSSYVRFVWAYNSCNNTLASLLSQTTSICIPLAQPCPDMPVVSYGGFTYNTVLIGDQCWLKENLNIGIRIDTSNNQTNNGIIEKYCYDEFDSNCIIYGGLYQWDEIMNYSASSNSNPSGIQGICPTGWHLPSDSEWCQLTTYLDPSVDCSDHGYSGTDAGGSMKEVGNTHWASPNTGASNLSGFTGLAGGFYYEFHSEYSLRYARAHFWSSTETNPPQGAWIIGLTNISPQFLRIAEYKTFGLSVRCIKDECNPPSSPSQGTHAPLQNQIIWNWNPVSDATGYKWGTENNPNSATDLGTDTTYTETGLNCNTSFTRYIWAYSSCGYSDSQLINSSTLECPPCGSPITDSRDGKSYNTVLIGTQCWMQENLNFGTKIDATSNQTNNGTFEKYCYQNLESNCNEYGGLYQWNELMNYTAWSNSNPSGRQGICPIGWHLPSDNEWSQMEKFLDPTVDCSFESCYGSDLGLQLKEPGTVHWIHDPGVTNSSGFTALPGGLFDYYTDDFTGLQQTGRFYTASSYFPVNIIPLQRYLYASVVNQCRSRIVLHSALSARCVRDDCVVLSATEQGTHNPSANQIVWNWNTVSGATGYKWNYCDNYFTATDIGTSTSYTEAGIACNTSYKRYVWAYNDCGYSNSTELTQATSACSGDCGQPITDSRDGKVYNTVLIGTQCWLAQNLNHGTRIDTAIVQSNNGTVEKYCLYQGESYCNNYGGLYTWDEMMNYTTSSSSNPSGRQGICPAGWHLPSDAEWCQLEADLDVTVNCSSSSWSGTDAGGKMKESGTTHWYPPNTGATNSSGFTARPGGNWQHTSVGFYPPYAGHFWSCTENTTTDAWFQLLHYENADVFRNYKSKDSYALSVRCLKD